MRLHGGFAGLLAGLALLAIPVSSSSAGILTKIRDNGPDANRVVIVVVAEGYTSTDRAQFDTDAEGTIAAFFAASPWSAYAGHANVYTDFVASNQSGADKPAPCYSPEVFRDTAFGARYCGNGSRRLLLVNTGAVLAEVNAVLPLADVVGVLVNDTEYGGAGGSILTFSNHASARSELFLHELGHTFARLADEYSTPYPGFPPGDGEPNVDFDCVRGMIDWDQWIEPSTLLPTPAGSPDVGCFEGARYLSTGIYRPVHDCKMRTLDREFCPPCSEATIQSIYAVVSPVDGAVPSANTVPYDPCDPAASVSLEVLPLLPTPASWITAAWDIDGSPLAETGFTASIPVASLGGVARNVRVTLSDETDLVRRPFLDPMTGSKTWRLEPGTGPDRDGDTVPDGCDCAPDDPDAQAPPDTAPFPLHVRDRGTLSWPSVASAHQLARGRLSVLRPLGDFSGTCASLGPAGLTLDTELPGVGDGFWYLVRGINDCGQGPFVPGSDGLPPPVSACP